LFRANDVGVLTHHVSVLSLLHVVVLPLLNTVRRLFLLKAAQNGLVLYCNPDQVLFALFSVERLLGLEGRGLVEGGFVALHDIGHLLQQNSIFSFDFGVSLCIIATYAPSRPLSCLCAGLGRLGEPGSLAGLARRT
jgi:hypothetical protein